MKKYCCLLFTILAIQWLAAQNNTPWQGKKCAIVLTYDDAIDQHLDNAIPVLDSLGFKASFYVTAYASSTRQRLDEWKRIALNGHELGNHTLYHPCIGGKGREWVKPDYDLNNYSVQRIVDEIRMTNTFLQSLDGKTRRTFAFTCADSKAGGIDFSKDIKNDFVAMRTVRNEMHQLNEIKLADVDCYMVNNHSAAQMKEWVDKAIATNSLLVILFHGVGGGNGLDVSIPAHRELLNYIKQKEKDIWVAPMIEVADYINSTRKEKEKIPDPH
jgi:peptidoglycan/xylan/chitin deacetylase (PgdA/CDA1 family)